MGPQRAIVKVCLTPLSYFPMLYPHRMWIVSIIGCCAVCLGGCVCFRGGREGGVRVVSAIYSKCRWPNNCTLYLRHSYYLVHVLLLSISTAMISALKALQDKIRNLELERAGAARKFRDLAEEAERHTRTTQTPMATISSHSSPPPYATPSQDEGGKLVISSFCL